MCVSVYTRGQRRVSDSTLKLHHGCFLHFVTEYLLEGAHDQRLVLVGISVMHKSGDSRGRERGCVRGHVKDSMTGYGNEHCAHKHASTGVEATRNTMSQYLSSALMSMATRGTAKLRTPYLFSTQRYT